MPYTISSGSISSLATFGTSVGDGTIGNIAALAVPLAIIVVVIFSRNLIMMGFRKLGL